MQISFRIVILIAALLSPALALAHGGGQHFMGVLKALDEKSLTVETKDKKDVRFLYDSKTKFEREGAPTSAKELALGERVVVHAAKVDGAGELRAVLVKVGAAKRPEPAP